jgi:carboxymethylenebutenolidase
VQALSSNDAAQEQIMSTTPLAKAQQFDPEALRLFDQYVHGIIDRRGFLHAAARFSAGTVGAAALLAALSPQFAMAQKVSPGDARIKVEVIEFDSPAGSGKCRGYLARPAGADADLPAVLVVHENRGLNPHIEDIARRLALDGFIAFAPDALFPLGGYPGDEDRARTLFAELDQTKIREDFVAAANLLMQRPDGNGRLGVVGFCYGGAMANYLATRLPELDAAVAFYGGAAPLDQVKNIKAKLMLMFGEQDERVNAGWPAYEAALKEAGVRYKDYWYAGAQHGFNNDTTPRYDEAAAAKAWKRTVTFFKRNLRAKKH